MTNKEQIDGLKYALAMIRVTIKNTKIMIEVEQNATAKASLESFLRSETIALRAVDIALNKLDTIYPF